MQVNPSLEKVPVSQGMGAAELSGHFEPAGHALQVLNLLLVEYELTQSLLGHRIRKGMLKARKLCSDSMIQLCIMCRLKRGRLSRSLQHKLSFEILF